MPMVNFERILIVVAHPDDEVLGCGGSIVKWASQGASVGVAIATDGESARLESDESIKRARQACAQRASAVLGTSAPRQLGFPDQVLDQIAMLEVVRSIEETGRSFAPDLVVTHSLSDLNKDHRLVSEATSVAFRPNGSLACRVLLHCEVPSTTEVGALHFRRAFAPNLFIDISEQIDRKESALLCYESELRVAPHPRSLSSMRSLASWRGASIGALFAEAFEIIFWRL